MSACRRCGESKSPEEFNWANKATGLRQTMCRACFREYNRQRYLVKQEQIKAAVRARYRADPERARAQLRDSYWRNVEKRREAQRAYSRAHPRTEEKRAWERADRAANPEKWREKSRRDYQRNAEAVREFQSRRRAIKLATQAEKITSALLAAKWDYWGGSCWLCGGEAVEWDHVKPLARRGSHILANLRPACRSCNAQKSAKWPVADTTF